MPVYDFSFAPPAAGKTCTVVDESGATIATGTVPSSVGLDGATTLSLTLAASDDYVGFVEINETSTWFTNGVLNVVASITAGGGGILPESTVVATVDTAVSQPVGGVLRDITFANVLEGEATFDTTNTIITPGLYAVDIEIDFAQPATDRLGANITLRSQNGTFIRHNLVVEGDVGTTGYVKLLSGVLLVTTAGIVMNIAGADGATDDLVAEYAYMSFAKIG